MFLQLKLLKCICTSPVDLTTDHGKAVGEVSQKLTNDDSSKLYYELNGRIPSRADSVSVIDENSSEVTSNEASDVLAAYEVAILTVLVPLQKVSQFFQNYWQ
ncbi:MAG: hypothetical protein JJE21_02815 [Spirochaetaceae bacterium]|nr:hypothetical protein [Spirochaetaceae bacterium]